MKIRQIILLDQYVILDVRPLENINSNKKEVSGIDFVLSCCYLLLSGC
jgi:hypothetical protein